MDFIRQAVRNSCRPVRLRQHGVCSRDADLGWQLTRHPQAWKSPTSPPHPPSGPASAGGPRPPDTLVSSRYPQSGLLWPRAGSPPCVTQAMSKWHSFPACTQLNRMKILQYKMQFSIYLAPKFSRIWIFLSVLKTICANGTMFLLMPFKGQIFKNGK